MIAKNRKSKVEELKVVVVWIDGEQDDSKNENKIESKWIRSVERRRRRRIETVPFALKD